MISLVENVPEVNWVVASGTILLDRFNNIVDAFETTHISSVLVIRWAL
jgi:hypothetical protein